MLYISTDIQTTADGDLVLNTAGDIKTADPIDTVSQAVNAVILTNKGDLLTAPSFGANIGNYYGERNNTITRTLMEQDILASIKSQGLIDPADIEVDIVPLDVDKVTVIVTVNGTFMTLNSTGQSNAYLTNFNNNIVMAYLYPYSSETIQRVS